MSNQIRYYNRDDPGTVLALSQQAASLLSKSSLKTKSQLLAVVSAIEEPSEWAELEHVFHACLRSGDDESAHLCLQRLTQRFGAENYRVMALRGLYQEAEAKTEEDLRRVVQGYNQILKEDPMNVPIHKRRTALIRSLGRPADALECLVQFLASFPADGEAWCELADMYRSLGLFNQAIFSLEEAIMISPNAWNLHARLGELNYCASQSQQEGVAINEKFLHEAIRRFARSIELCEDYVRGYYGLKLATDALLSIPTSKGSDATESGIVRQLNEKAVNELRRLVQQSSSKDSSSGTRSAEIIAAQALLEQGR